MGIPEGMDMFFDITQNAAYMPAVKKVGCLLRKSWWWSYRLRRPLVGLELLGLMGNFISQCPFGAAAGQFSENQLRSFAGNGMHIPCAGAALLVGLVAMQQVGSQHDV